MTAASHRDPDTSIPTSPRKRGPLERCGYIGSTQRVLRQFENRTDLDADEIAVQTYHAFAASIVREHALLLGLDGDPALLDRAREWQLFLEALDRCSFTALEIGWLPTFIGRLLTFHDELQRHVITTERVREWCVAYSGNDLAAK